MPKVVMKCPSLKKGSMDDIHQVKFRYIETKYFFFSDEIRKKWILNITHIVEFWLFSFWLFSLKHGESFCFSLSLASLSTVEPGINTGVYIKLKCVSPPPTPRVIFFFSKKEFWQGGDARHRKKFSSFFPHLKFKWFFARTVSF